MCTCWCCASVHPHCCSAGRQSRIRCCVCRQSTVRCCVCRQSRIRCAGSASATCDQKHFASPEQCRYWAADLIGSWSWTSLKRRPPVPPTAPPSSLPCPLLSLAPYSPKLCCVTGHISNVYKICQTYMHALMHCTNVAAQLWPKQSCLQYDAQQSQAVLPGDT